MKLLKVLAFVPLWFVLVAQTPTPTPPASPTPCNPPKGAPTISLSPAAGRATTKITASGANFTCNTTITLYWDQPGHVAGSVKSNGAGGFSKTGLIPFPGDKPGTHRLCAVADTNPCANFLLMGPPSPSPKASPVRTPSPSPSSSPSPSPILVQPDAGTPTALDILTRPPFVFFPIIAVLGILGAIAYWALSKVQRTPPNLPTASVVHRSARPDMGPLTPILPPVPQNPAPEAPPPPAPPPEPGPRPPEPEA